MLEKLEAVVEKGFVKAGMIFIDATHIKGNANRKKHRKEMATKAARVYDGRLREEIKADRAAHGKKPLRDKDDNDQTPSGGSREISVSTTGPWAKEAFSQLRICL